MPADPSVELQPYFPLDLGTAFRVSQKACNDLPGQLFVQEVLEWMRSVKGAEDGEGSYVVPDKILCTKVLPGH